MPCGRMSPKAATAQQYDFEFPRRKMLQFHYLDSTKLIDLVTLCRLFVSKFNFVCRLIFQNVLRDIYVSATPHNFKTTLPAKRQKKEEKKEKKNIFSDGRFSFN